MKVMVVHNSYQSHSIGGEDVVVKNEIRALKAMLGTHQVFEYIVSNDDIRPTKLALTIWGSQSHYQAIFDLVKLHNIDIVHIHNFFPLLTPTVFKAAFDAGAKVVHTLHNYRWWCLSGVLYRAEKGICEDCVTKKSVIPGVLHQCYRNSTLQSAVSGLAFSWYQIKNYQQYIHAYFVLSDFQKEKLKNQLPFEKMHFKPNSVHMPKTWVPIHEKQHFLFVGRLEAAKGIELLLSTWVQLPAYFQLDIIGEGDAHWQKTYAHTHIRFLGKLPHETVLSKMGQAKYLVHSSLAFETFGLTITEAMAQGTPVIGIDIGPRSELIQSGRNGFLCQPDNFKETLLHAMQYPHYEALSHGARQSAEGFDSDTVTKMQTSIYHQLLEATLA